MKKVILLCAAVVGVFLMWQTIEPCQKKDSKMKEPKMECTLTLEKNKAKVGDFPIGEVAIKNVSNENLVIDYSSHPFYNLDLQVFDPAGKKISRPYLIIYSIITKRQLMLRPGETYRSTVGIFATLDQGGPWEIPGTYKVTAIYEYKKEKAVSKQVELTLTPK